MAIQPAAGLPTLSQLQWGYLGAEAQRRVNVQLQELYIDQEHDPTALSVHNPRGNLLELQRMGKILATRVTMCKLLLAAVGQDVPDYDDYRNHWKRGDK